MTGLPAAEAAYEVAEAAFLDGLRRDVVRATRAELASSLATAAEAWNSAAYVALHSASQSERADLDRLTERTEVLSELWVEVRDACKD